MIPVLSFKGLFGKVLGVAGRVLPGPIGAAARIGSTFLRGGARNPAFLQARAAQMARGRGFTGTLGQGRLTGTTVGPAATGRAPSPATQARENAAASGLVCPPGETPNKSRYHLLDGTLIEPGTRCVARRRIDVANPKALRRSIRRETGFAKLAKRVLRGSRFKVVSASTGARRGPRTIVESGPGSVITR